VTYLVTATNNGAGEGSYTLDDELSFGDGVEIVSAEVVNTTPGGVVTDPAWNGQDQTTIVTDQPIAGGAEHVYTVTVVVDISAGVTVRSGDCEVGDAESGSGFLNHATMTVNGDPMEAEDCTEVPGEEELTIDKDVSATTISLGNTVNYTVTVANTGTVDFTDDNPAEISDDLSDVLDDATWVGNAEAGVGELTFGGTELTWHGPLAVGDSVTITYSVRVNSTMTGSGTLHNEVTGVSGSSNCAAGSGLEGCQTDSVIEGPPPPPAPPAPVTPDPIPVTG
jgi:fimbrial isopeptide formation D2 family protein